MHNLNLKNKNTILILFSILLGSITVAVFLYLAFWVRSQTTGTINNVGNMYMDGLNERITRHFSTTMDYRFAQLEEIIEETPDEYSNSVNQIHSYLANSAIRHDFDELTLCGADGWQDSIYGNGITMYAEELFVEALTDGDRWVATGFDTSGNSILLMGIPAQFPMQDGTLSSGLIVGMPLDYMTQVLEASDTLASSHIIRKDGSYVLRSDGSTANTFRERLIELYSPQDIEQIELANTQVLAAMQKNENYSVMLTLNETREHWYFTRLPYSNWYLTTRMPFGTLDQAVNMLTRSTLYAALFGCLILLVGLLILFIFFNNMTKTQLLALNRARKEAERANKAKSEFLSSMSHDIRTPMNAIVGMTAIAAANIDNRRQLENCLNKITLSSKHLLGLINDVLDMSKIESGKLTMNIDQVSLREVMDSIVSIVQPQVHAKNQTFNVSIHDIDTENVCCDGVRLNQVLINLLSNAIKFTPEKGTISLALHEEASPKGENFVRINLEVKDTGYGMSPEFTERIFDSFSRENTDRVHKTEGTGLGMSITKYIIDTMGGTISLESKQGVGTTFYVTLDLEKASIQETDMKLPNWHMLLVDDDPMLCKSVIAALKDIGVQAESVLDGESAIKLVKKRHDENNDFQIILLDWKLPGINGIDAAKEIRRQTGEEIPILLISAYDWTDIEEDARTAGINGFICKPLFKSTLYYGLRPYANDPDDKKQTKLKKTTRDFTGKKILLAEDNDLNWEIAETLLSEEGLELDWAENGQVCVEVFQQSDVGYYDAILMDIRMPVMNGYDAAKTIRSLERPDAAEIPIIAMTADAFAEDIQRCLDVGMNAHIAKPIDVHDVLVQLDKYMKP